MRNEPNCPSHHLGRATIPFALDGHFDFPVVAAEEPFALIADAPSLPCVDLVTWPCGGLAWASCNCRPPWGPASCRDKSGDIALAAGAMAARLLSCLLQAAFQ
jgi:hypothetical protein